MTPEILKDLLEKVRALDAPNMHVEADIARGVLGWIKDGDVWRDKRGNGFTDTKRFTSSLDACLSLLGQVLPKAEWTRNRYGRFSILYGAHCWNSHADSGDCTALLDCILQALLSQQAVKETT
ncbi:MAG: hypothetical protein Q7T86_03325 [Hyphomicrobiaceae bacterium]|nr:hypothetical protein [Hyphomicrobiaceae bacterium]